MATQIHATLVDWVAQVKMAGKEAGAFGDELYMIAEGRMERVQGEYQNLVKVSDAAIFPGERFKLWPTIAFEFGYTEPYEDLKEDVKLLLKGTEGKISKVILIKLQSLKEGETEIQARFVEMWCLAGGRVKKDGGRKTLFPPPKSHAKQRFELTLKDLLGDQFNKIAHAGWTQEDNIDLPLDPLRNSINHAVKRHLFQKGILPES